MARCVDCYWFTHQHPAGREASTCQELGEKASNPACPRFRREADDSIANVGLPVVEDTANYRQSYRDILHEAYRMLKDGHTTVREIFTLLQQQGVENVDMDSDAFNKYLDKLSDIYVLHRLCLAMGLGAYTEQIVSREIEKRFPTNYVDRPQKPKQ